MTEEHVYDLLPGYALGILDADDLERVKWHLPGCSDCQRELESYRQTTAQIALVVPPATPAPVLKERVMQRVQQRSAQRTAQTGETAPQAAPAAPAPTAPGLFERLQDLLRPRLGWALGALAVIVILALAVNNLILARQIDDLKARLPDPELALVHLQGTENARWASGYLMAIRGEPYGSLTVDNAPRLEPDQQYQLWLIKAGQRSSGGVFSVNADGYGVLQIEASAPLDSYDSFGITIEPAGGSPGPTGTKILGGDLNSR